VVVRLVLITQLLQLVQLQTQAVVVVVLDTILDM
jgi:hypothetical protein